MAECIKYKYMFEVSNEITKCSECPFADETYRGCNLYSNGCVDRYHYAEFDTGKPDWCKLKELVRNGEGLYDIYEPPDKKVSKHVTEVIMKSFENMARLKWTNKKNGE